MPLVDYHESDDGKKLDNGAAKPPTSCVPIPTSQQRQAAPRQLESPPTSPLLPAITDQDLRNGVKLDFVKHFRLGEDDTYIDRPQRETAADGAEIVERGIERGPHKEILLRKVSGDPSQLKEKNLKLSSRELYDLASSPESLPIQAPLDELVKGPVVLEERNKPRARTTGRISESQTSDLRHGILRRTSRPRRAADEEISDSDASNSSPSARAERLVRPSLTARSISTPATQHRSASRSGQAKRAPNGLKPLPPALKFDEDISLDRSLLAEPSPMPSSIPAPPLSMPTYLQLELSAGRPSPLYIHRSLATDFPYESSRVKLDRLKNFMLLPPQLEQVLWFGALSCLDAWLSAFTILPLRFLKAIAVLSHHWSQTVVRESDDVLRFIYKGSSRVWLRHRRRNILASLWASQDMNKGENGSDADKSEDRRRHRHPIRGHRTPHHSRNPSTPSALLPDHKADILRGLLIIISCTILMYFDASRMYHGIRGQAAIKLYVIYNVLEVCDRLFSALGQDVLECLFSKETLERNDNGRSKVLRPFWLFMLALAYNLVHSTALFYQVITLNVAVNSYSNALLTLLMSNQFVEIKSTVFKKFEKENLFQLTCADVVERFQLWLMLMIIASRNVVETGGLSLSFLGKYSASEGDSVSSGSILPRSFTLFPAWTGQVLAPFFLVLGSEMLVDWLKHAYINKFNNTKPAVYGRFLDVLAKDYYTNAFADQNLTRRLGLPVIPLSCLFIRASVQTYHMFIATYLPPPLPSTATSLSVESATTSAATTEALAKIDNIFRRVLQGPNKFGLTSSPYNVLDFLQPYLLPLTTLLLLFLVLLLLKILLGMALLSFARSRYQSMKERENVALHAEGRRVGGWGTIEVDEDKRTWIYADDPGGVKRLREREARDNDKLRQARGREFDRVERYSMVAKRIW